MKYSAGGGNVASRPNRLVRSYFSAVLVVLPALMTSCAMVGPDYIRPETDIPERWVHAHDYNATPTQGLSEWWLKFDDAILGQLVKEALEASPDLRLAQAKLVEARARRDLAGGNRFPTVTASLSGSRSRSSAKAGSGVTSNMFNAGFDASWEPDVFGGVRRGIEAAEAVAAASQADLQNVQVTLVAEVVLNYVELRSFQNRLVIARSNLAAQSETLQITEWREQAGLVTALEVEQARANVEQTRAGIPVLNSNLIEVKNRLAILLGKHPAALNAKLDEAARLPAVPNQVAIGIPADTLRQRPDVRAAEQRLIAETARIGQQVAELYPGFNLGGTFGWKALTLGTLGSAGTIASSLIGSVTQTVFDAGRIRNQISVQNAVQEQALVSYEKTVLTALEDVENALASYANNRERQKALRVAAISSRNAAELARLRFESGLVDFRTVLDTERTRLSTEDSLASSEAEGLTSLISLYKALGGGWDDMSNDTKNNDVLKMPESLDHE